MSRVWQPGLFALPPGADFASDTVTGLLQRFQGQPPQALARVTIWANSARTRAGLQEAFDRRGPLLLPRIHLIADLGAEDATTPPEASLARELELGWLIEQLLQRQPDLRSSQSVPGLAASLAALMAEMQSEGAGPDALDRIDAGQHAQHWQRMLGFLRIAADFYLQGDLTDREARQYAAAARRAEAWAAGRDLPQGPVLVAGSTGSHGATRLFMQAVARLQNGAVVLPGYDFTQPDAVWAGFGTAPDDHPQGRFLPLRDEFGPPLPWLDSADAQGARNALVSLALRPAPVTDQWIADGPALGALAPATQGLTLIEADQPATEADAVALVIREAVERGQPVALFSPDQPLVRRITVALDRWHLLPDDPRGLALHLTASGLFLRHVAALFGQDLTLDGLLTLLKQPICATGAGRAARGEHLRQTRDLELHLRRHGPAFPDGGALRDWGARGDAARQGWTGWLALWLDQIAPLATDRAAAPLQQRLDRLVALAEGLAAGPGGDAAQSELWRGAAGGLARAVMDLISAHAGKAHPMPPRDMAALISQQLSGQFVRLDAQPHPLIRFFGARDARTEAVSADAPLVILAGLNEGSWPQMPAPDPWLSRQMRLQAGLTVPERQIGLAAHDFQQAIAAPQVVLTRARRDADAETIPSRWLNRLMNLLGGLPDQGGPQALADMRARGRRWLDLAAAMNAPSEPVAPARRPSPIPPGPALKQLSVTQVRTLIRDPYAIYARHILGLKPLDPLRPEPGAAMRGQVLHSIVEAFLTPPPDADTPPAELRARLMEATDQVLAADVPWPSARIFWRARIEAITDRLVADELARAALGRPVVVEDYAGLPVAGMDFRLIARPDRIDALKDGTAHIYDYKSGKPPSDAQMKAFDKQLPLEAAMAVRGAFDRLGPVPVSGVSYIQLGGEGATEARDLPPEAIDETWDRFVDLIRRYQAGGKGFTARRAVEQVSDSGDYDHLSRFGEWSMADDPVPEKVGGDD